MSLGEPPLAVLFVCLGNICRSPMAEGAFREAARKAGLNAKVDSVGTAGYHIGANPDPRAIATARANGVDIGDALGRKLTPDDFHNFTHIFAMDKGNIAGVKACAPRCGTARIALLLDVLDGRKGEPIPDPYYGDETDFEACWNMISEAVDVLVARLKKDGVDAQF